MSRILSLAASLGLALSLAAQEVKVEVSSHNDRFLPGEIVEVEVRITNLSGRALAFGADEAWLDFEATKIIRPQQAGTPVPRLRPVRVGESFLVENSFAAKVRVDLAQFFDLTEAGRYSVSANLRVAGGAVYFSSATPRLLEVIPGAKIWEQEFGVPSFGTEPVETRKYVVLKFTSLREPRLYVQVGDPTDQILHKVSLLGQVVSFARPEMRLDRLSNLHVLHQSGARTFIYSVVTPQGVMSDQKTHAIVAGSRPVLRSGDDGLVTVAGGAMVTAPETQPPASGPTSRIPTP